MHEEANFPEEQKFGFGIVTSLNFCQYMCMNERQHYERYHRIILGCECDGMSHQGRDYSE